MSVVPIVEKGLNTFDDPLKGWPNDDLLLDDASRAYFRENRSALFRVLDVPRLRERFQAYDRGAAAARRLSRRLGVVSVLMMGGGVMLAAATPLLDVGAAQKTASAISAALIFLGGCVALWHMLASRQRMNWLANRFWAERIRQFHFQFLINNLSDAAAAMRDDARLAEFNVKRERAFLECMLETRHTAERIRELEQDLSEERAWMDPAWKAEPRELKQSPEMADLLEAIYRLRVRIQGDYARLKLLPGSYSPTTRAAAFKGVSDLCSALVVAIALCAVTATLANAAQSVLVPLWVAIGVLSAAGLMMRALDHGLQPTLDHARNEWYLAALETIDVRFREGDVPEKVRALRELERLSYQELRRFTISHMHANFLM